MKRFFIPCAAAAFIYALWLRQQFIVSMPDPIFQQDSGGYMSPALNWLYGQGFYVSPERTFGYPLWISFWLKATHHFKGLLIAQHGLALLTAIAAAALAYQFLAVSRWSALLIFFLISALPRLLVYSHSILTDAVYTNCLMFNALGLVTALKRSSSRIWILLAFGAWLGLLLRPVGLSFVFVLGLIVAYKFMNEKNWALYRPGILAFLILCLATCAINLKLRGFWGFDQFGGASLFGTAAPYISPSDTDNPKLRNILLPIYQNHALELADSNWVRFSPEGPVSALRTCYPMSERLNRELLRLTFTGIFQHPWHFFRDQILMFVRFLWERSKPPEHIFSKEFTMARGLTFYAAEVQTHPLAASLISFSPSNATMYFNTIARKPLYPYEPTPLTYPVWPWVRLVRWVELAALIFTPLLLQVKKTRSPTSALWLIIASHIILTDLGGDRDARHALPIEPLCVILMIAGADAALKFRYAQ